MKTIQHSSKKKKILLNKIEEVLDITFLNEGKFDIYIKKNNMIVKLNIDSRLHDYWEIDVEKNNKMIFWYFEKKLIYIYLIIIYSKMEAVCEFIKEYINGNSVEEVNKRIEIATTEEFDTLEDQKQYILDKLMDIEEILCVYNITIEPLNYIVADLQIAKFFIVKMMIGISTNDELECWNVTLNSIIKYRR
jgi:hypothetical protein